MQRKRVLIGLGAVVLCLGGCAESAPPLAPNAVFHDVTAELGLPTVTGRWPDGRFHMPEILQGGVGLFDYDGDGDLDLFQARIPAPDAEERSISNRLFRQEADGSFVDVTDAAGLSAPGFGQGIAIGDTDNDGDPDLYLANFGPDRFYRNNGDGTFTDATAEAGFEGDRWSASTSFFDYDRDGFLDLYVVHYVRYDPEKRCTDPNDRREYCGPRAFHGKPDKLYRNNGDGTFSDVTQTAGVVLPERGSRATGLGVACVDLTEDGYPDVFVANDAQSNQLWVNRGDGTFSEEGIVRGVAVDRYGHPEASMGVTVGDVNGDGSLDLFMTHMWEENNRLYLGSEGRLFRDGSTDARLAATDLEHTGFGCGFFDFDLDGDLDLAVANGAVRRRPALPGAPEGMWQEYAEPNQLYANDGAGRFEEVDDLGGAFARDVEVSRGLAFGDIDNDGDVDLVLSNIDNSIRVYRNETPVGERHWVNVRALAHGRDAFGAHVFVRAGGREQRGIVLAGYSYMSSNDPRVHFGLDASAEIESIEILWPDGQRETFGPQEVDRVITLRQGEGAVL